MKLAHHKSVFILAALAGTLLLAAGALAGQITVTGTVTDQYQIITPAGEAYDIGDTPPGEELVAGYVGKSVEVTGTLEVEGSIKIIIVESYRSMKP